MRARHLRPPDASNTWSVPVGTRNVLRIEARQPTMVRKAPTTRMFRRGNASCFRGREAGKPKCSLALGMFKQAIAWSVISVGQNSLGAMLVWVCLIEKEKSGGR